MSKRTTISLPEDHILTVTADEFTSGHIAQLNPGSDATDFTTVAASSSVTKGSFTVAKNYELVSDKGQLTWTFTEIGLLDDDTMATASESTAASSESVKAYVDDEISDVESSTLTDVEVTSPVAGEVLIYDATDEQFENSTLTAGQNISITEGDASITIAVTGIEDGADVTDSTNVLAALSITGIIDDDTLVTATDTNIATSESIKAYVDTEIGLLPGGHDPVTLNADDPTQETLNLSGQELQVNLATITTDGAMSAEDKSKLDGIEASADVTDETNVKSSLNGATISSVTVAVDDKVLVQDTSDSDNLKYVTTQSIADLAGGGAEELSDLSDVTFAQALAEGQILIYGNELEPTFFNARITAGTNINVGNSSGAITIGVTGIESGADVTDAANVTSSLSGAAISAVTVATDDKVLIQDTSDSSNLKSVTAQSIADLAASGMSNPMTTAEDIIVGGTSGAPARLAAGDEGDVLTISSGAVAWDAPTVYMSNPMTTAEDLIIGGTSGAPARLGVGDEGDVLTVSSGALAWDAPSTAGGWELIASATADDDATITFTGLRDKNYKYIRFVFISVLPATNGTLFRAQTSVNEGSTWMTGASDYAWFRTKQYFDGGIKRAEEYDMADSYYSFFGTPYVGNSQGGICGEIVLYENGDTTGKPKRGEFNLIANFTSADTHWNLGYIRHTNSSPYNAIKFYFSSGNVTSGTILAYGWSV